MIAFISLVSHVSSKPRYVFPGLQQGTPWNWQHYFPVSRKFVCRLTIHESRLTTALILAGPWLVLTSKAIKALFSFIFINRTLPKFVRGLFTGAPFPFRWLTQDISAWHSVCEIKTERWPSGSCVGFYVSLPDWNRLSSYSSSLLSSYKITL